MDNYIDRDMIFKENSAASGNKVKKKKHFQKKMVLNLKMPLLSLSFFGYNDQN